MVHMIEIFTNSGGTLDLDALDPSKINIEDIAIGLSRTPRWCGQTPHFMSVAQHSVLVSNLCEGKTKLAALLHDASEAYICDIPKTLKASKYMEGYRYIEQKLQLAIFKRFGITEVNTFELDLNDRIGAAWEVRDIWRHGIWPGFEEHLKPLPVIFPLNEKKAFELFMNTFKELYK